MKQPATEHYTVATHFFLNAQERRQTTQYTGNYGHVACFNGSAHLKSNRDPAQTTCAACQSFLKHHPYTARAAEREAERTVIETKIGV